MADERTVTTWTTPCDTSSCIQTRTVGDRVEIRDTEYPEVVLSVPAEAWEAFLASVRGLPPGGETREEWGVADVVGRPDEVWPTDEVGADRGLAKGFRAFRRTITTHVGPWRPVDTEETKP